MKAYKFCLLSLILFAFLACEDETKGISRITYYVSMELNGDEFVSIAKGDTYTEQGVVAKEGDTDVSSSVTISGTVDTSTPGTYTVKYSATNTDGFSSSIKRTVIVYDTACPIASGKYSTSVTRGSYAYSGYSLIVLGLSANEIYVEDLLGGFYYFGRGYGAPYSAPGKFAIAADNTLSLSGGGNVAGWGDAIDSSTGTYDPATGTITLTTNYVEMVFNSVLTK